MNKKSEALKFLRGQHYLTLATVEGDMPYAATMLYLVDEDLNFYLLMKENTKKFKNLMTNPQVAFTVSDVEKWQSVQARGRAELLENENKAEWIEKFMHILTDAEIFLPPPVLQLRGEGIAIVRIIPTWLRYADFHLLNQSNEVEGFDVVIE